MSAPVLSEDVRKSSIPKSLTHCQELGSRDSCLNAELLASLMRKEFVKDIQFWTDYIVQKNAVRDTEKALRIISTILSNILAHPTDIKYTRLCANNTVIQNLLRVRGAEMCILRSGFALETHEMEPVYVFRNKTPQDLAIASEIVEAKKHSIEEKADKDRQRVHYVREQMHKSRLAVLTRFEKYRRIFQDRHSRGQNSGNTHDHATDHATTLPVINRQESTAL
jgi:hypothetical protein